MGGVTSGTWVKGMAKVPGSGSKKGGPSPNPGGRPKGSVNKRTQALRELMANSNYDDPAEFLAATMSDKNVPTDVRVECAAKLMPYLYPKLSAVEVTGQDGGPITVDHQLMEIIGSDESLVEMTEELHIQIAQRVQAEINPYAPSLVQAEPIDVPVVSTNSDQ